MRESQPSLIALDGGKEDAAPAEQALQELLLIGVNYRTASLELREKLAVFSASLPETLKLLHRYPGLSEVVILSTCNRVEVYVTSRELPRAAEDLVLFFSHLSGFSIGELKPHLYCLSGREAAKHLFRVAAGLDSMILGESEITAQVKQAYQAAVICGTTKSILNRVFQKALHAAKVIRCETTVAQGQASIGSVIASLASQLFGSRIGSCSVLLWGAGKAAEATTKHLMKLGIGELWVVNRTQTKAQELASLCQGRWLSWEEAIKHLTHVDIAVVCTQAPHHVIEASDIEAALAVRQARPLFLVDLAVPRNIDPAVTRFKPIRLYNIDDLKGFVDATVSKRQFTVKQCETIIEEQADHLWRWWQVQSRKDEAQCQLAVG